jgi:hypothetical protein
VFTFQYVFDYEFKVLIHITCYFKAVVLYSLTALHALR